ncbi:MAG: hypothetical protein HY908_04745 [Myxococcales bacterium]|nr:hypothetical protein [Myxococcales bacterium]
MIPRLCLACFFVLGLVGCVSKVGTPLLGDMLRDGTLARVHDPHPADVQTWKGTLARDVTVEQGKTRIQVPQSASADGVTLARWAAAPEKQLEAKDEHLTEAQMRARLTEQLDAALADKLAPELATLARTRIADYLKGLPAAPAAAKELEAALLEHAFVARAAAYPLPLDVVHAELVPLGP